MNTINKNIHWLKACSSPMKIFFIIILSCATVPAASAGAEPATAKFLQNNGKYIVVQLQISRPVPGSVIFTINLPDNIQLTEAKPPAGKYDRTRGQVKWLLRGLSPGTHEIRIHLSSAVSTKSLKAEIRYLNSATGKLCILPVEK